MKAHSHRHVHLDDYLDDYHICGKSPAELEMCKLPVSFYKPDKCPSFWGKSEMFKKHTLGSLNPPN